MSVAILIKFKSTSRDSRYIPVATQGAYHSVWCPTAEKLGLRWVPRFEDGPVLEVRDLPALMNEFRRMRDALAGNPANDSLLERIDSILEELGDLNPNELAEVTIG